MKLIALLTAFLLIGGCGCASLPNDGDIEGKTLTLEFSDGWCSGTAVGPHAVLTATHCFERGSELIKINGKPATLVSKADDGKDHTLAIVDVEFKEWARLGGKPVQSERVRLIGTPAGNDDVYREGYVARVRDDQVWLWLPGFGGDSGSALFDDDGRIVAVLSGAMTWVHQSGAVFTVFVAFPLAFTEQQWAEAGV